LKTIIIMIEIDNWTYTGFSIIMIGLAIMILFAIILPYKQEKLFIKIRAIGTIIAMIGGLILLSKLII
jgi:hypothetical protein